MGLGHAGLAMWFVDLCCVHEHNVEVMWAKGEGRLVEDERSKII